FYAWKVKFGGMDVSDAQKLKGLEAENAKLKRLLAEAMIDNAGAKDLLAKNGDARAEARSRCASDNGASDERASQGLVGALDRNACRPPGRHGDRRSWHASDRGPASSMFRRSHPMRQRQRLSSMRARNVTK